jgi:hypothetical protein
VVVQELQQVFRFFGLEADDAPGEAGVDVESFLARYRVNADNGMLRDINGYRPIKVKVVTHLMFNRVTTDRSTALLGEFNLSNAGVNRAEALETLLELRGEALVGLRLRGEESVSSSAGCGL